MAQNPLLNQEQFEYLDGLNEGKMSYEKSIKNVLPLLLVMFAAFCYVWYYGFDGFADRLGFITVASLIIVIALIFTAKSFPKFSLHMAFPFAGLLGVTFAGFSFMYANLSHGILGEAALITIISAFYVFLTYKPDLENPKEKFNNLKNTSLQVTLIYCVLLLIGVVAKLGYSTLMIKGIFGFIFAPVFAYLAVFSFISDLDSAEKCAKNEIPRHFEWYITLALILSMLWQIARIPEAISFLSAKKK